MKKLFSIIFIAIMCICMVSCGGNENETVDPEKSTDDLIVIDAAKLYDDVNKGDWFEEPVAWSVSEGVMLAAKPNTFGVTESVTVRQVVYAMWKAAGCPGQVVSAKDSNTNAEMNTAVDWAIEEGIVQRISDCYSADAASRLDTIDLFWNQAGEPLVNDVEEFEDAQGIVSVNWARSEKITYGVGNNLFAPERDCTKSMLAAFLFRAK